MLDFLQSRRIRVILIQIHTDFGGSKPKLNYETEMKALLNETSVRGMEVHALDGGPDYTEAVWADRLTGQIREILSLNASQREGARFRGVHYDIEFYFNPISRISKNGRMLARLTSIFSRNWQPPRAVARWN